MKRLALVLALAFAGTSPATTQAAPGEIPDEAILASQLTVLLAPIRTEAELEAHLATRLGKGSPLDAFASPVREAFVADLAFGGSGLGSLRHDVFAGMRAQDAFRILGLFGWQDFTRELEGLRVADDLDRAILDGGHDRLDSPEDFAMAGRLARLIAPIRSQADLEAHLAAQLGKDSPLDALEPAARERFLAGLVFAEDGLAGLPEQALRGLTVLDAYRILGLFGWQHHATDLPGLRVADDIDRFVREGGPFRGGDCEPGAVENEA
jgi:hypothetical protein